MFNSIFRKQKNNIYFDSASFVLPDCFVLVKFLRLSLRFFNPMSESSNGIVANEALNQARKSIARNFGAHEDEIIFVPSATFAINQAMLGIIFPWNKLMENLDLGEGGNAKKPHFLISSIEHSAVINTAKFILDRNLADVTFVDPDIFGNITAEIIKKNLRPETVFVSCSLVNNEIATINDIREIAKTIRHHKEHKSLEILKAQGFPYFHCDMSQGLLVFDGNIEKLGVDFANISFEKIGGISGLAVLFKKRNVNLSPITFGGSQEKGLIPSTQNVALVCANAFALEKFNKNKQKNIEKISNVKDFFIHKLVEFKKENNLQILIHGNLEFSSPNILSFTILGFESAEIIARLDARGIFVSSKSSCNSRNIGGSHVLSSLYKNTEYEKDIRDFGAIRISFDKNSTKKQASFFLHKIKAILAIMRKIRV